jgi:hypothetical protein
MTKKAGSGSISQRHGSANPDPDGSTPKCHDSATLAHLLLLKGLAGAESLVVQIVYGGLNGAAARLHRPLQVLVRHPPSAEHVAVSKIL